MYKKDLALKNVQWLICHKTQINNQFTVCKQINILDNFLNEINLKLYANE